MSRRMKLFCVAALVTRSSTRLWQSSGSTRRPKEVGLVDLAPLIAFGASPRATLAFSEASRAVAFLRGRGYVVPEDVKEIAKEVLRHRILLTYEAEAENVTTDAVVERILERVEVP